MAVYQRKWCSCKGKCGHSKRWWYDFSVRGQRFRVSVPDATTKWQAEQAEAKAKNEIFEGRFGREPSTTTLKEFVEKVFLSWAKAEKRSWRNDVSRSKPILAYFRNKRMRDITQDNVREFKKQRRDSFNGRGAVRAPASVDREIQLLSRIFSLAIERGLLQANPCKSVGLCAVTSIMHDYLTEEEEAQLLRYLTGRRAYLADVLQLNLYTGMRKGELLSLHKDQIEFSHERIRLIYTKNGKPRFVPIHPDIQPMLERLVENAGPHGYLFENSKTGKPIGDFKNAWRSALQDAGLRHIRFHVAGRHTFGTRAAANGANLKDIQDIMDHADINTTMRYVHATEQGKRRAVEAAAKGKRRNVVTFLVQKKTATG